MSVRPATLCDSKAIISGDLCPRQAVGRCVICDSDICADHAAHPKGAVMLTIASRALDTRASPPIDQTYVLVTSEFTVCSRCVRSNALACIASLRSEISEAFVTAFRARIAGNALAEEKKT